jgi:hypothetical protein
MSVAKVGNNNRFKGVFWQKTPLKTCKNEIAGNERSDYLHNALV